MTIQLNAQLGTFFKFYLALGDLGSDFWTGSRYLKFKKDIANSGFIYWCSKWVSDGVYIIHNSILFLMIGGFRVLITRHIGANTSMSPVH